VKVGHGGLVHAAVPSHVTRLPHSVPVHVLVVLMVDGSLSGSPLSVRIGHGRVLRQDAGDGPVEQVWVVDQGLGVEGMVIKDDGAVVTETAANTSDDEVADPSVGEPATDVEVLDGELADDGQAEEHAHLSAGGVASPVEVGLVRRAGDRSKIFSGEPALKDLHVVHGLRSPLELSFLKGVFGDTETDQLTVLDVVSNLGVDSSSESVIVSVLKQGTSE